MLYASARRNPCGPGLTMPDSGGTILVIEDEKSIRRFVATALHAQGFHILEADTGAQGMAMILSHAPDAILLDLGLPDTDGGEIIDFVRRSSQVPIIVLSARDRERDKVDALERGADDYLSKPFGLDELRARIRVALRHYARISDGANRSATCFTTRELTVDLEARSVVVRGNQVHLTLTEFRLLATLIRHVGKVLTHRLLLKEVWGPGQGNAVHLVRVHMANLRAKLERDPTRPEYILTDQGVGYRLVDD